MIVLCARGLDGGGAVAADFEADVSVRGAGDHVEFDPGGGEEGAALDVADEAVGEGDDFGVSTGDGNGRVGVRDDGPFALENGDGLGGGGGVFDDEACAVALVGAGLAGFEERFEGAGEPWG